MRGRLEAAVAVLFLSTLACGGGGGGGAGLEPPTEFKIEQGGFFDEVVITWTEPSTPVDGYELEGRLDGGAWEPLLDELIQPGVIGLWAELVPTIPELITIGVRIRSVRGAARSAWSPEASLLRGVRPPSALVATLDTTQIGWRVPPVHLGWTNESVVATALELERAPQDGPAANLFAPVAALDDAATSFDDLDAWEGGWIYRLRAGVGAVWSMWAVVPAGPIDVVPPSDLRVTREAGGVRLDWTNRSRLAEQVVERLEPGGGSGATVTLPVGTNQYLDPVTTLWPATRFVVSSRIMPSTWASGPAVGLGAFTLAGPVTLAASARLAPGAVHMALSDGGQLHAAVWGLSLALERDTGSAWSRHDLAGAQSYAMPAVLADAAGHPHTVVYRGYPDQPTTALVHEWYDGAAWQEETVTLAPASDATFALGAGGALHVLVQRREPGGTSTTVHHHVAGGNVTSTDVVATVLPPSPGGGPYTEFGRSMAVARDGTAWVAMSYFAAPLADASWVLLRRTAAGAWSQEVVPTATSMGMATAVAGSADVAAIFYDSSDGLGPPLRTRLRTAAGWGAEETVAAPFTGMVVEGVTLAADGARLDFLLKRYPDGLWLSNHDADGWQTMQLGPLPPMLSRLGLTGDGRTTVVVPHGPDLAPVAPVSLFIEPP